MKFLIFFQITPNLSEIHLREDRDTLSVTHKKTGLRIKYRDFNGQTGRPSSPRLGHRRCASFGLFRKWLSW